MRTTLCWFLTAMQLMLDICSKEAESLDFPFKTVKFVALRIGPRYRHVKQTKYSNIMLCFACTVNWGYLGHGGYLGQKLPRKFTFFKLQRLMSQVAPVSHV